MERMNDTVTAKSATINKKGWRGYKQWFADCERTIKSLQGLDKPRGYEDYKRQIEEMRQIQDIRKRKK
jgi:hypothetical protein